MSEENKKTEEVVNQQAMTENEVKEVLSEEEMDNVNGGGYFDGYLGYTGPKPVTPAPKPVTPAPKPVTPAPAPNPVMNQPLPYSGGRRP